MKYYSIRWNNSYLNYLQLEDNEDIRSVIAGGNAKAERITKEQFENGSKEQKELWDNIFAKEK